MSVEVYNQTGEAKINKNIFFLAYKYHFLNKFRIIIS